MGKLQKDEAFYKKLWSLMVPIVLQNLMLAMVAVADAFMLGGMDQNYMSAVSLATQIQFIQNMFLAAATASLGILGAQYWGKGDKKTLDEIFCMALRLCGLVSAIFFVGCVFFGRYLMLIFTNEDVLINYGVSYLKIAGFSYLLTGISQCYLVIMKTVLISYKPNYLHPSMRDLLRRNKQISKDFWKCGLPLLGACLFWGIGFTSYSSFMGHLGTDAAAANSVAAVVRDIICCFSAGISSAAGIMIGNELGAGNLEKGKRYGIRLLKISFACGIFASLLMCISAPIILHFVKLTPQAQEYLKGMFAVRAFYMNGRAVNDVTINGIFGAGGDTLFDMYSLAVCMWCLAIPLAAAGTYFFHWPVVLVYACTCIDEVGKLPWVLHHFRKYKWVKDLTH